MHHKHHNQKWSLAKQCVVYAAYWIYPSSLSLPFWDAQEGAWCEEQRCHILLSCWLSKNSGWSKCVAYCSRQHWYFLSCCETVWDKFIVGSMLNSSKLWFQSIRDANWLYSNSNSFFCFCKLFYCFHYQYDLTPCLYTSWWDVYKP